MVKKPQDKARERRRNQRILYVRRNKKSASDAFVEEATEEAFDWLERGGVRRIWTVIKVVALILAVLIIVTITTVLTN